MLRAIAIVAALALASTASAQTIDAKGKCHDAKGRMAAMSVCKPAASPMASAGTAKKCVKGKPCGNTCISMKDTCHK